jgi:hypothetical protein
VDAELHLESVLRCRRALSCMDVASSGKRFCPGLGRLVTFDQNLDSTIECHLQVFALAHVVRFSDVKL